MSQFVNVNVTETQKFGTFGNAVRSLECVSVSLKNEIL